MELNIDTVKALMLLMTEHKVDKLKLGELELTKTRHETPKDETKQTNKTPSLYDEEEILYWSTSTPGLTPEQIQSLSANPMPKPKRTKKDKDA